MQPMRTLLATALALTLFGHGAALAQPAPPQRSPRSRRSSPPKTQPPPQTRSRRRSRRRQAGAGAAGQAGRARPRRGHRARLHHRARRRARHPLLARRGDVGRRDRAARRHDHPAAHPRRQGRGPDARRVGGSHPGGRCASSSPMPSVTVVVRQMNSRKVFITGEVARPGAYPSPRR